MAASPSQNDQLLQIYPTSSTCVSPFWREKYENNARKYWDVFYKRHENKFFKDRHYLDREWGLYFTSPQDNDESKLDTGRNSDKRKVVLEAHKEYQDNQVNAFVCDATTDDLSDNILPSSVDIVTMIFTLSAVSPEKMPLVLSNIRKVLKPNGILLLRDYAVGDLAQERLCSKDQKISENFYVRGDGTRAFYFSEHFLKNLFEENGFCPKDMSIYCKQLENRSREIVMNREGRRNHQKRPMEIIPSSGKTLASPSTSNALIRRRWIQAVFSYVDNVGSSPSLTSNGGEEVKSHVQIMNSSVLKPDIRTLKKPADGATDIDMSYCLAEMFGIPHGYDACTEITLSGFDFKIKGLSREHQHTCKSTGLMLWESAHLMSSVISENPTIVAGKRILELGCGSGGICSMVAAKFADLVVATDGDSESLNLLHQNINSNLEPSILDKLHCLKLEWGNADDINAVKELSPEGFDVIIGTDVTYVSDAILPLFETAGALISTRVWGPPPAFILCHVFRRVDEASIISTASSLGFGLVDNWPFTDSSSNSSNSSDVGSRRGTIASWFSQEGSCKRNSHITALTVMYFETLNKFT
ncbi:hypothetical protein AMTRI_Chr05g70640 [Amborella trichopoda]